VRKIEPVNVVLQRSQRSKPFVVHVNKLKKCLGATPCSWLDTESGSGEAVTSVPSPDTRHTPPDTVDIVDNGRQSLRGQRRPPSYLSDYYC